MSFEPVQQAAAAFVEAGNALGGEAAEAAAIFAAGITGQGTFVAKAVTCPKAEGAALQEMLAPTSEAMGKLDELAGKRTNKFPQHCKMVNDAAQAFTWVLDTKPLPVVSENMGAAMFTGNKLLTANKGDEAQTAFVKKMQLTLQALSAFVKENHAAGVAWNSAKPAAAKHADPMALPAKPPGKGLPPPPPPPPPPPAPPVGGVPVSSGTDGASALFAEIRAKGDNITKGLKHVEDKDKMHKQKRDHAAAKAITSGPARVKRSWTPKEGTPKLVLEGDKQWIVQYQRGTPDEFKRVEIDPTKRHVINVFRCVDTLIVLRGPCNTVQLCECLNTHIVVEGTVGPVEASNCESIELLFNRLTPSAIFSVVKGATVHVTSEEHIDVMDFVSSCSVNLNVVLEFSEDKEEIPIPEQYETAIVANKPVTTPVDHGGA